MVYDHQIFMCIDQYKLMIPLLNMPAEFIGAFKKPLCEVSLNASLAWFILHSLNQTICALN